VGLGSVKCVGGGVYARVGAWLNSVTCVGGGVYAPDVDCIQSDFVHYIFYMVCIFSIFSVLCNSGEFKIGNCGQCARNICVFVILNFLL